MPAFLVVLILATIVFVMAYRPACIFMDAKDFTRRRNLWFALTLVAFLSHNFWLYACIAIFLVAIANRREPNPPALYFSTVFALPVGSIQIPGLGLIDFFFELSHIRLMALLILLPAFIALRRQADSLPFGRAWPDRVLVAYLLLSSVLYFRDTSVTNALRQSFYLFIDIFLPYFVCSRALRNLQAFRDVLMSFVLAIMVLSIVAVTEILKHWLIYRDLLNDLGLFFGGGARGAYLERDGMVRAAATAILPISLGYVICMGFGFYLFLKHFVQQVLSRWMGMTLLVAGMIAPLSRGPWVGAAVLVFILLVTGRNPIRRLTIFALITLTSLALIASLPGGEKVINLLPYIGKTEVQNIEYRERLFSNSMIVIERNPLFGSTNYLETPEMEAMRQGQGIIDTVNTYLVVALRTGYVGALLFVFFFVSILVGIFRAMRMASQKNSEEYLLGQVLLATLLATMVVIATVSSISFTPVVYWPVAGMGVAYVYMVRKQLGARLPIP